MLDVLRQFAPAYLDGRVPLPVRRVLERLMACRTAALGGHRYLCSGCGFDLLLYNSCGDRHCPQCQGPRRARWVEHKQERLLPVPYFHVVFTLPRELRPIARAFPREVYGALMRASADTLLTLSKASWSATPAVLSALHTWTRDMRFHPHVHCLVSAGGLKADGTWHAVAPRFLFHVRRMGAHFRGRFLALLAKADLPLDRAQRRLLGRARSRAWRKRWNVWSGAPLGNGGIEVVKYLATYAYQVAISDYRIVAFDDAAVTIATRNGKTSTMPGSLFVRRFAQHILPHGFRKVRQYGLLAPNAVDRLELAHDAFLDAEPPPRPRTTPRKAPDIDLRALIRDTRCPSCGDRLTVLEQEPLRAPLPPLPPPLARGPP